MGKPKISASQNTQDQKTAARVVREGKSKAAWSDTHTEFGGQEARRNANIQKMVKRKGH